MWGADFMKSFTPARRCSGMRKRDVSIIAMVFLCFYSSLCVAEERQENAKPVLENIGFMKNPPKELQEKFPMCDAFLEVEWIDKEKKIGYSKYQAKLINDKGQLGMELKTVWALVHLDDLEPSYTLDVYQYQRQGRMKELFEMVKDGEPTRIPSHFAIRYKGVLTEFYAPLSPVLSDFKQTVCIAYPDEQRAWIIEGRSVGKTYNELEKKVLENQIKETGGKFNDEWFQKLWVLDINFDGESDFIHNMTIEYSSQKNLFQYKYVVDHNGDYFLLTYPPKDLTCRLKIKGNYPLITDGKNYYISNQCNLTELTK